MKTFNQKLAHNGWKGLARAFYNTKTFTIIYVFIQLYLLPDITQYWVLIERTFQQFLLICCCVWGLVNVFCCHRPKFCTSVEILQDLRYTHSQDNNVERVFVSIFTISWPKSVKGGIRDEFFGGRKFLSRIFFFNKVDFGHAEKRVLFKDFVILFPPRWRQYC